MTTLKHAAVSEVQKAIAVSGSAISLVLSAIKAFFFNRVLLHEVAPDTKE